MRRVRPLSFLTFALACACASNPESLGDPDERLHDALSRLEQLESDEQDPRNDADMDPSTEKRACVDEVRRLALQFPGHAGVRFANAALATEWGDRAGAQHHLDRLRDMDPTHVEGTVLRVQWALEDGNLRLAERLLTDLLRVRPDAALAHESLAGVQFLQEEFEDATRSLERAVRLGGDTASLAYHRGLLAERQGALETAATAYRDALRLNEEFHQARTRLTAIESGIETLR